MGNSSTVEFVKILVVDDQPANLIAFEAFLRIHDYHLEMADSAQKALELLDQHDFALILTDVMMPGTSGVELARQVKQNAKLRDIPIIFLTAKASDAVDVQLGYAAGGVDYLLKPLDVDVVKTKVEVFAEVFRQKRRNQTLSTQLALIEQREQDFQLSLHERQASADLERAAVEAMQMEKRTSQGHALAKLGRLALVDGSIDELMQEAAKIARTELDAQMSSLFILRDAPAAVVIRDGEHWQAGLSGVSVMNTETSSWIQLVFSTGEPVIFNNNGEKPIALTQELTDHAVVAGAGVMIHGQQEPFGVLSLFSTSPRQFTVDETGFLQAMGNILGIACERKKSVAAVRDLTRSNNDLEQFSFAASHDLQEPLRKISSFSKLLADDYKAVLAGDGLAYLDHIVDGVGRMKVLIDELLDLSTVGMNAARRSLTAMDDCVQVALENLQEQIRDSKATIKIEALPTLLIDKGEIQRLFQNLLSNAIKYCSHGQPSITISSEIQVDNWRFCVRDNGIGIQAKYLEQIFELFKRLHGRGKYPGTGIGLATCKKIVECHGGRIWAESAGDNGTSFYFTLPL